MMHSFRVIIAFVPRAYAYHVAGVFAYLCFYEYGWDSMQMSLTTYDIELRTQRPKYRGLISKCAQFLIGYFYIFPAPGP